MIYIKYPLPAMRREREVLMGKKDTMTKEYMSNPRYFADAFNYYLFNGEIKIREADLSVLDPTEMGAVFDNGVKEIVQRMRDVLKQCVLMQDDEKALLILGVENQSDIHYAMPVKNMIYDALNYSQQVKYFAEKNKKEKLSANSAEFLSGLRKSDKLKPVITLVVYWGGEEWDGPRSLKDMLDTNNETILKHVSDYRLNLIVPREVQDFSKFSSDFGKVMRYIAASGNRKEIMQLINDPSFQEVGNESVRLINECTNSNIPIEEEKEKTNMCKGLAELIEDSRIEGRIEGRTEGRLDGRTEGKLEILLQLFQEGDITLAKACALLDCSEGEFLEKVSVEK